MTANIISPATSLAVLQAAQGSSAQIVTEAAKNITDARELKKVEDAAKEFESVFVAEMLKPMFDSTSPEAPFNGGKGEEIFHSMLVQEYGKILAQNGGVGMTDQIKEQMIKMQEQADNAAKIQE